MREPSYNFNDSARVFRNTRSTHMYFYKVETIESFLHCRLLPLPCLFPQDLMLAVSDWEFSLWYIGGSAPSLTRPRRANMDEEEEEGDEVETARPVKSLADRIREPIFRSAAPSNYFACGACSPSRPAVGRR